MNRLEKFTKSLGKSQSERERRNKINIKVALINEKKTACRQDYCSCQDKTNKQ